MLRYHIHSYIARCIAIMLASLPWFAQYIQIQCFSLNCSVFDIWMHISTELSLGLQVGHYVLVWRSSGMLQITELWWAPSMLHE